jgi:hypothetical protein
MKLKKKYVWLLGVIVLLVFAGFNLHQWAFAFYNYESSDRGMADAEYPLKGRGLKIVQADFENYKEWKGQSDLILYRTSKPKWWVPSLLLDNIFNERWKLPYMEPSPNPKSDYFEEMGRFYGDKKKSISPQVNPSEASQK